MLKKAAALFLVWGSIAIWVGCSNSSSRYVYAAIPGLNEIVAYREDPNSGILTQLTGSPVTAGSAVGSIVMHPSGKFLYAANAGANSVSLFTISSTGALTEVTPASTTGSAPTVLTMDTAGTFLYVGNAGSNSLSVFSIDASSGSLAAVSGSPFPLGISPLNMKVTPSGSFLYVSVPGSPGFIEGFSLSQGQPTVVSLTQTGTDPYGLAIDPSGTFLYTANKLDNAISEFTINSDGTLTQLANSPLGEQYSGPTALLIDNSGKYLYVANQASTNVAAYTVGSDGSLTLLTNSPFATGAQPSVLATDSGGKHLFVGNQSTTAVQSFDLDTSSGTLTSVATYTVTGAPTSIAVTP
jgi:6-phosphogluconolactonase (cycloisomerase 2 family)